VCCLYRQREVGGNALWERFLRVSAGTFLRLKVVSGATLVRGLQAGKNVCDFKVC
jgi:hypothetical protein